MYTRGQAFNESSPRNAGTHTPRPVNVTQEADAFLSN
jgi:hypothetical protein